MEIHTTGFSDIRIPPQVDLVLLRTSSSLMVHLEEESHRAVVSVKETHYLPTSSYYVARFSRVYVTKHKRTDLSKGSG